MFLCFTSSVLLSPSTQGLHFNSLCLFFGIRTVSLLDLPLLSVVPPLHWVIVTELWHKHSGDPVLVSASALNSIYWYEGFLNSVIGKFQLSYRHLLFLCIGSVRQKFWLPPEEGGKALLFGLVASVLSHTGKVKNKVFHGLVLVLRVFLVGWLAVFLPVMVPQHQISLE